VLPPGPDDEAEPAAEAAAAAPAASAASAPAAPADGDDGARRRCGSGGARGGRLLQEEDLRRLQGLCVTI
jgi:hypothetical protein